MTDESRPLVEGNLFLLRELDAVNRRIDGLDNRVTTLDEHGSRGVTGLQVQLVELTKDLARVEVELRRTRASRWQAILAVVAALLPVYLFVGQQLLSGH